MILLQVLCRVGAESVFLAMGYQPYGIRYIFHSGLTTLQYPELFTVQGQ